ncbi:hypothetical protein GCK32_010984 [Trichostrongylus colubriformis]|uniref:Uncharacterized protein n=1 Tax=Trichostrongylus colubriformis TaxID=6319 RepID=A0AAN8FQJ6_TRICO
MTTNLSSRQGLLTRACNRLKDTLKNEHELIANATDIRDAEKERRLLQEHQWHIRRTIQLIETDIKAVDKALENYSIAADNLSLDTPMSSDILEKTDQSHSDSSAWRESPTVPLAPVPIPKFDGKLWKWETFWGAFNHSVHSRDIDDLHKMNYLMDALQGEARECVKQYDVHTYPVVIAYLQEKYGDQQALVDELLRRLQNPRASSDSLRDQGNLCERLTSFENQLRLKGEQVDNVFLQKQLLRKFSTDVQRHILRQQQHQAPHTQWDTNDLLMAVKDYIRDEAKILHEPIQRSMLTPDDRKFLFENDIALSIRPNTTNIKPDILLGCSDLFTLLGDEIGQQQTLPSGLRVIPSKLGHLVISRTGALSGEGPNNAVTVSDKFTPTQMIPTLERDLSHEDLPWCDQDSLVYSSSKDNTSMWEQFFSIETSGVSEFLGPMAHERQDADQKVWNEFEKNI